MSTDDKTIRRNHLEMTEAMLANNLLGTHFTISEHPDPEDPESIPLFPEDHPAHQKVIAAQAAERRAASHHYIDLDDIDARDEEEDALRRQHGMPGDSYRMDY